MSISRGSTKETEAAASSATGVEPIEADEDDIGSCARLRDELRGEPGAREHDQACLLYDSPRFEEATQALEATQRAGPGPCDATLRLPDRQEDGPIVPGTAFADSATTSISNRSRAAGSLTEVKPTRFGRPSKRLRGREPARPFARELLEVRPKDLCVESRGRAGRPRDGSGAWGRPPEGAGASRAGDRCRDG